MRILFLILSGILLVTFYSCFDQDEYDSMRRKMVDEQIIARGIRDRRVINAMLKVPRHLFVPYIMQRNAYDDKPLPIGEGQTISQPYIVAIMTELLELQGKEKVLEIGTGSGYQAAILAEIVEQVYTIEIVKALAQSADKRLSEMGYKNITVKYGDGYQGWKEYSPFDGIIVTAAPDHIPQPLIEQLRIGGRMIIPVGSEYQELKLIRKTEQGIIEADIIPVRFVPMTGEAQKKE